MWNDKAKLEDVTETVIESISTAYNENSPEFIYFMILYHVFSEFLEDISEDVLPNEATGFKNSKIWEKLYDFQRDAVLAIITGTIEAEIEELSKRLLFELHKENPDVECFDPKSLVDVLADIFAQKNIPFIFIIDEWDCIFRMHKNDKDAQIYYLNFLRNLLKDRSYVALAYMTGILPIKKYGEHSALNMFTEISIAGADNYAEFTGFTEEEVKNSAINTRCLMMKSSNGMTDITSTIYLYTIPNRSLKQCCVTG